MGDYFQFVAAWHWTVSVPVLLFVALALSPFGRIWKNEADRKRWIGLLIQNGGRARYRRVMTPLLDRIDATLSPHEVVAARSPARIAWSYTLLNILTLLAFAYPIIASIGQWIAGSPLNLGGLDLALAGTPTTRIFLSLWIGVPLFLYLFSATSKPPWRLPLFVLATVVWVGGLFLADRFGVPVAVAFAGAVASAIAFAGAGGVAVVFAGAVAGAGASAIAFAVERLARKNGHPPALRVAYLLVLLAAITVAVTLFWNPDGTPGEAAYLIAFLTVLPILNALADFASVGLTRYLLRQGINGTTWGKALWDVFGGALIFAVLGCTLITYFHLVRTPDGPLIDLELFFLRLSIEHLRPDHWWLFVMLFSTLIPTALHAMVGTLTILIQYPAWVRRPVVNWLTDGATSDTQGWLGSMAVCAMITLSVWVPVLILWFAFTANHGWVLKQIIVGFEAYARLIGALP